MAILQQQEQQEEAQEQEGVTIQPRRPRWEIRSFINSPYLFILAPILVGGFFLVLNPQYVEAALNYPFASAFILAIPVAVIIIKLVLNFFSVIEKWIKLQFERARASKRSHFFEIVTAVFMFVSVCEAGPFFNDIQHNVLGGTLGYITVLAFDLIAVVCIDARRKELAKGGSKSGIYLAGVLICAGVSMVANLYSALLNFQAPTGTSLPDFLKGIAPYVGIMFPIMIVFLAFSRDVEVEVDDAEMYKKQQQKRIDFLAARRYILEGVLREMEQIDLLKKREFFLKSILFTRAKIASVVELATARVVDLVNGEIKALKDEIARREQVIAQQAQTIASQVKTMQNLTTAYDEQYKNVLGQVAQVRQLREELSVSYRELRETVAQQVSDLEKQTRQSQTSQDETIARLSEKLSAILQSLEDETNESDFDETEEDERDTDPTLPTVTRNETNGATITRLSRNQTQTKNATNEKTKRTRGASAKKAAAIIKKSPDITPIELAKRTQITSTYARKLLAKYAPEDKPSGELVEPIAPN